MEKHALLQALTIERSPSRLLRRVFCLPDSDEMKVEYEAVPPYKSDADCGCCFGTDINAASERQTPWGGPEFSG